MTTSDAIYAMGYSLEERERLIAQASMFRSATQALLHDAGIGPGMRVLDLGCGVGDVSLLLAEMVGPDGDVVGVDRDPRALALARSRAADVSHLSFAECDVREVGVAVPFDAVVGRLVLLYVGDPVSAIRRAADYVRPGGIVAFQDLDFTIMPSPSWPFSPLLAQCGGWIDATFRAAGMEMHMGLKYRHLFLRAGLPEPRLRMDCGIGGGPDFAGYRAVAEVVRSIMPMIERFGVATTADIDIETLADRLRDESVAGDGTMTIPPMIGAWTRTLPVAG